MIYPGDGWSSKHLEYFVMLSLGLRKEGLNSARAYTKTLWHYENARNQIDTQSSL